MKVHHVEFKSLSYDHLDTVRRGCATGRAEQFVHLAVNILRE
jgi:hypothetical protein